MQLLNTTAPLATIVFHFSPDALAALV